MPKPSNSSSRLSPGDAPAGPVTSPPAAQSVADEPSQGNATMAPRITNAARLVTMLGEPGGASLAELAAALGWQAHTIRAALSGLRKAGRPIDRQRRGDETIYLFAKIAADRIAAGPDAAIVPESRS